MPTYVVVSGGGSYAVGSLRFEAGKTACDDEAALEAIRQDGLDWVEVLNEDEATPVPTPEEVKTGVEEDHSGENGPLQKTDFAKPVCTLCDPPREFANTAGFKAHQRAKHPQPDPDANHPETDSES